MKSKITIINVVLISIAAIATVLNAYNIISISAEALVAIRWTALAGLIIYAFIKKNLTTSILISMLVGTEIGYDFPTMGTSLHFLRQIFLQMIKTVIAPLLFATLVTGIAGHSDLKQVGRMAWKSMVYFYFAKEINKPAIFICMGLYLVYNFAGVFQVVKKSPVQPAKNHDHPSKHTGHHHHK